MEVDIKLLSQILEKSPEYIFWKDHCSIYQGCNENFAKLVGVSSPAKVIGKNDNEMPWGGYTDEIYLEEDRIILETGCSILQKEVPMKLGSDFEKRYLSVSKVPLYDGKKIIGILGIFIDISERKKSEKALIEAKEKAESASQTKSVLIANINHDVRTPAMRLLGMIQELLYTTQETDLTLKNKAPLNNQELLSLTQHLSNQIKNDAGRLVNVVEQLITSLNKILELLKCI